MNEGASRTGLARKPTLLRYVSEMADLMGIPRREVCLPMAVFYWKTGISPFDAWKRLAGRR